MKESILIASASSDDHAYLPVAEVLEKNSYPVIIYKTDKVLTGEEIFTAHVGQEGSFSLTYQGNDISADGLGAAWYRKVGNFRLHDADRDMAKQLHMNNEVRAAHDTIWSLLPDDLWLNSPNAMAKADRKLGQLLVAQSLGFSVPETTMSNSWDEVVDGILIDYPEIIVKMFRGVIADKDTLKGMYTTRLNKSKIEELAAYTIPFPGIYQPYIKKHKEWRVTVVGEDVFPAAIYTVGDATTDWREHQTSQNVKFKAEELSDVISEKCVKYLGKVGLKFGAFDLIETVDGETFFLECNPNGQYGWLEEALGFPITKSIAKELMSIAQAK